MNDSRKFSAAKNQLIQLLILGMPPAIITAYFQISNSTCSNYIKKLRGNGEWSQKPVRFLESINNVLKTFVLIRQRLTVVEEIDRQRLQVTIEKVLQFQRIMEILKISINSLYKLTQLGFSPEVPKGYRNLIKAILPRDNRASGLGDGEERSILFRHLTSEGLQIGDTENTWFYPMIDNIISEYARDLRDSIRPTFGINVVDRVEYMFSTLTDREAEILRKFFGVGCEAITLNQISDEIGLTFERTRQIKEKALRRCGADSRIKFLFNPVPLPAPPVPTASMTTPIESLDISVRAFNNLKAAGINIVEELVQLKRTDLLKRGNIGKKTIDEIEEVLKRHNLGFQD